MHIKFGERWCGIDLNASLIVALLAYSMAIPAQAGIVLQLGVDAGGDEMVRANFTDGETQSIDAGEFTHFDIGFSFPNDRAHPTWESQLTIGWKNATIQAENGSLDWTRYPIDFMQFYVVDAWRFGAGLTWHFNPTLEGSGVVHGKASFDDAMGFLLEADFLMGPNREVYLGGRLTLIEYDVAQGSGGSGESVDGDSVGAVLGMRWQ